MSLLRILRWLLVSRLARRLALLLVGAIRRIGWRRLAQLALRLGGRGRKAGRFGLARHRSGWARKLRRAVHAPGRI